MSTSFFANPDTPPAIPAARRLESLANAWLPVLLVPVVVVLDGYHPFAGDAGLYVAGIRHILDPSLYSLNASFVAAFTHRSLFAWTMAAFLRLTRLPLDWALLIAHLVSIWLFLVACGQLAGRVSPRASARACAVLLAGACCALPVAGTALVVMDPYVTARSFSTPLSLFALVACLDRHRIRTTLLLVLTAAFHPLMAVYTAAFVVLYALLACRRYRTAILACIAAIVAAGVVFAVAHRTPIDSACREAVLLPPRSFLFLTRWRWYEDLGVLLPLVLFGIAARRLPSGDPRRILCLAALLLGGASIALAAFFVPPAGPYQLVPFQVLRSFHILYGVGVVLCGGFLSRLRDRSHAATVVFFVALFTGMFLLEPLSWPGSARLELPSAHSANPYEQAFLWIRGHTPRNAVFAFHPDLVYLPGEDEQGFRAITLRDHLADDKDAGVAAVFPALARPWAAQRNPELSIGSMSDAERRAVLLPLGATWLLLPPTASTALPCPFHNSVAQVCRLTP
jgi:hypothetical protein